MGHRTLCYRCLPAAMHEANKIVSSAHREEGNDSAHSIRAPRLSRHDTINALREDLIPLSAICLSHAALPCKSAYLWSGGDGETQYEFSLHLDHIGGVDEGWEVVGSVVGWTDQSWKLQTGPVFGTRRLDNFCISNGYRCRLDCYSVPAFSASCGRMHSSAS